VDGSEAMFTTICALLAAGFESNVSSDKLDGVPGADEGAPAAATRPAVEVVREFYRIMNCVIPGRRFQVSVVWPGVGPAPAFQPVLRRDELPPEVIAARGFQRNTFRTNYQEQKMGTVAAVQPIYNRESSGWHDPVSQIVFRRVGYLREILEAVRPRHLRSSSKRWWGASPT